MRCPCSLLPLSLAGLLSACAPPPALVPVALELALEFDSDALLEVYVHEEARASCASLLDGLDASEDPVADRRVPASRLNDGGAAQLDFAELPADVALAFYARAIDDGGTVLAEACRDDVVIPSGGEVDVSLTIQAP